MQGVMTRYVVVRLDVYRVTRRVEVPHKGISQRGCLSSLSSCMAAGEVIVLVAQVVEDGERRRGV